MKITNEIPNRAPPPTASVWQPGRPPDKRVDIKQNYKNALNKNIQKSELPTMKKERKKKEDRLLKRLPLRDRRQQMRLREQIANDPLFLVV